MIINQLIKYEYYMQRPKPSPKNCKLLRIYMRIRIYYINTNHRVIYDPLGVYDIIFCDYITNGGFSHS